MLVRPLTFSFMLLFLFSFFKQDDNNPAFCTGCRIKKTQVKIHGSRLSGETASEVYAAMKDKNIVVIHVAKARPPKFCFCTL
ncbi:uncharacterized protein BYT42DRAFT_602783, partial [Radiomyces spectabilis]|uniref:uncharacterized protein n=1 Tax=Radiomyces spectabilis TaxID=64574 RepID=UPI00221FAD27